MEERTFLSDKHNEHLPVIRIKRVILQDFKSVGYGDITFNCGREFIPCKSEADILGLYGQNGSGKTGLIEALSILRWLMSGTGVPNEYTDCITIGRPYSSLEFVFDLQYPDETVREASYSFHLSKRPLSPEEKEKNGNSNALLSSDPDEKVVISDELFSVSLENSSDKQVIIDTCSDDLPFTPEEMINVLAGTSKKTLVSLEVKKQLASDNSRSFIFMTDTLSIFNEYDDTSVFFEILVELRNYARHYLYVIDTKSTGFIRLNLAIPFYTRKGRIMFHVKEPEIISNHELENVKTIIKNTSSVLEQLVPGLEIGFKELSPTLDKNGEPATLVMLVAYRDGRELPLRDESDGVRKILSVLSLIIAAYNQPSVTVAIDEFDAGIYEYLLGEILQALEESGLGQFIFTSHNLRPLEVINRKFLYFTTTNPNNRYVRLDPDSSSANLREAYFREILVNEQDEEFYRMTKRYEIILALMKAGDNYL